MIGIGRLGRGRVLAQGQADAKRQKIAGTDAKEDAKKPPAKKQQLSVANKLEAEFLCPLTLELPEDPVLAADGRVYEREAISKLVRLAETSGKALKSPVTNQVMEKTLLPCPLQMRNAMTTLLESGAITAPPDWWVIKQMRAKAEKGDVDAMYSLARLYESGRRGLEVDPAQAFGWFKKCADFNDNRGLAKYGMFLLLGQGTPKNETEGAIYLGMAASMGSKLAAFVIGGAYDEGSSGMPKDSAKAEHWLSKVVGAQPSQLAPADLKRATEMLEAIRKKKSEGKKKLDGGSGLPSALPVSVRFADPVDDARRPPFSGTVGAASAPTSSSGDSCDVDEESMFDIDEFLRANAASMGGRNDHEDGVSSIANDASMGLGGGIEISMAPTTEESEDVFR